MTRKQIGWVAGLAAILHAPSLFRPLMDLDEGSYASIACRLLDGGVMYRDGIENKFPGAFYAYREIFAVFGRYNMVAVHVVVTLIAIAVALLVGSIAKRYAGPPADGVPHSKDAGKWAALLYVAVSASYYPKMLAGNSEMFAVLPAALTMWCYLRGRDRGGTGLGWFIVAGACGALAMMCKQVALATFAAVCADRVFAGGWREPARAARDLALMLLGFAGVVTAIVLELRAAGVLDDAVFWTWTYVMHYYIPAGSGGMLVNLATSFLPFVAAMSPLVYLAVRGRDRGSSAAYWWLAGNVAASLVGGRMYGHYYVLFLPALCTLAGVGAARVTAREQKLAAGGVALLAAGVFVAAIAFDNTTGSLWRPQPDYREAAHYVAEHTKRDERIFVWGWFPALYIEADRCPSTRFVYTHLLSGRSDASGDLGHAVPEAWDMLEHDLEAAPPAYILDTSPGEYTDYHYRPEDYPRLWQFIAARYELDRTIEGVRLFRRRE